MITANCEVYENENGDIGVLTRTVDNEPYSFWLDPFNVDDVSMNFDKRLVEFYLFGLSKGHTYAEWEELLKECGYPSVFRNDFQDQVTHERTLLDLQLEHYDDPVLGFRLFWVPKNRLVRLSDESVYDDYGTYIGQRQIVEWFDKEDFIET